MRDRNFTSSGQMPRIRASAAFNHGWEQKSRIQPASLGAIPGMDFIAGNWGVGWRKSKGMTRVCFTYSGCCLHGVVGELNS